MRNENLNSGTDTPSKLGRRWVRGCGYVFLAGLVLLAATSSVVFVDESEVVISERLGRIVAVYDRPGDRGLHFKLPWPVGTARRFDRRVQLYDPPGREVFTRDKKNITVDAYVCWRIAEPNPKSWLLTERPVVRFFRALGNADVAESRLDSRVRSILATELGQVELSRLLNVANSESGPDEGHGGLLEELTDKVRELVERRPNEADSLRDRFGIEVVDVRIKRINFPSGNQQAVYERMKSERRKIAERYRSAGMAENTVIKSHADRQYNEILANANADAERIRGEAEADAIAILNQAHAQDPEFYRVIRTLDAYRQIINERTTLVLSASSNLMKLLTEGIDEATPPTARPPLERSTPAPVSPLSTADDSNVSSAPTPAPVVDPGAAP